VRVIISSSRSLLAAPNIRNLTELKPKTLAIMHGSSFVGDAEGAIRAVADRYEARLREGRGWGVVKSLGDLSSGPPSFAENWN
jgi:hypothetical protein